MENNVSSVVSTIRFNDLCQCCEKISLASRDKKLEYLKKYIRLIQEYAAKEKLTNPSIDISFYPILRLLLPQLDRERGPYGIKENTMAKMYIRLLNLSDNNLDAGKLLNFKAPTRAGHQAGDFAEVAYWILRSRFTQPGHLTIGQVNNHLDIIASKHAAHEPRDVDAELLLMIRAMSAEEQKWLIRMILKDMKLGLGQNKIFAAFHPDAQELFDVSNSLERVCRELYDPSLRLNEIEISLFSPFRAMLSERCDVSTVEKVLRKAAYYYVETKHDGERFQLHLNDGEFKYFSKNGYEYTDNFGSSHMAGLLTPHIARLLRSDVRNCILDGEMMAWNKQMQCYRAKGINFDVKSLKPGDKHQACFCVFDILLLNGLVLTNKPLEVRYTYLNGLFQHERGVLALTKRRKVNRKEEIIQELNLAIDNRLEGIILKDPLSVYKPNTRKGGWFKIKPEYTEGLMDHVDALIIGGYFGEGRQRGMIGHFLVAVAVPSIEESAHPTEFHSMGRVGSGYSMTELAELLQKLTPYWQKVKPGTMPPRLLWTKEKPDVWIAPENSYILEIKATEICYSANFKTGYTLKFPRVENIRYDKQWFECMTTDEFDRLRVEASGKLSIRHATANDVLGESPAKKPRQLQLRAPATVAAQFRSADLTDVITMSDLLAGRQLCVLSGGLGLSKQDIEADITRHGGCVVQNVGPTTYCAVAGDDGLRVTNVVKSGRYNVVRLEWLLRAFDRTELPRWTPADLLSSSPDIATQLAEQFDMFGDSFTQPATEESLLYALEKVKAPFNMSQSDMADMDIELFSEGSPFGIFRTCLAYFDPCPQLRSVASSMEIFALDFCFYGGLTSEEIEEQTSHIILHSSFQDRRAEFEAVNRQREYKFHIVTEKWVDESLKSGRRQLERQYYTAY